MRDGVILGKGNEEWNCSAPHGAGRLSSREQALNSHTVSEFKASMKGEVEGAFSSIIFSSEQDLSELVGTMQWIFKSKHRPGHKRKN